MGGRHYYLVTSLPPLGELGTPPPLTLRDLLAHVAIAPAAAAAAAAVLLSDDLVNRQAMLAGEITDAEPTLLTADQLHDRRPLPDYLVAPTDQSAAPTAAVDATWAAYFHHAADVATRTGSAFLADWTAYEVALRNALAAARAAALGLDPAGYLVATDLAAPDGDLAAVVSEWADAPDPLAGLRVLDAARWDWLAAHDAYYTFQDDELISYAAKLLLLHRWQRLTAEPSQTDVVRTAQ